MAATRTARRWPEWIGYLAALWSLGYGALGLYWASGGRGFPFGAGNDPGARLSVLAGARQDVAAPAIAVLGLVAAIAATVMARGSGKGAARVTVLGFAWLLAGGLTLLLPDFRILVVVAYAPIVLVSAPFGWLPGIRLADALPWPVVNQLICVAGGLVWAATATAYQRRSRGACGHCGRPEPASGWTTPRAAARWGRRATWVAVVIPLLYALTRWAWAAGIPLGITDELFREGQSTSLWGRGAALGGLAFVGAILTFGLIRPWGEVFPRRLPLLGGRPVPRALVLIPTTVVAVLVGAAGVMFLRVAIRGDFTLGVHRVTLDENWAALAPELLWPIWGVALGAAALGYYYRVRLPCRICGRG